jgi:hypothetical protein
MLPLALGGGQVVGDFFQQFDLPLLAFDRRPQQGHDQFVGVELGLGLRAGIGRHVDAEHGL